MKYKGYVLTRRMLINLTRQGAFNRKEVLEFLRHDRVRRRIARAKRQFRKVV